MVSTTGHLGYIPEDKVEEAKADGFRVIGPDEMRALRQQIFMEHGLFQQRNAKPQGRKRKSLIVGRGRGR